MSSDYLFTANEIVKALPGRLIADRKINVKNVEIDSRNCKTGSLFVPLKGRRTDGHFFLESALKNGAELAFITETYFRENRQEIDGLVRNYGAGFIIVKNILAALQDLARHHIRKYPAVKTIGITGSSGKTTVKEIIGSILRQSSNISINKGNFNSEIGLPLSVFGIKGNHEYAVFEMGVSRKGEMDLLVDIVRPHVAVVTNIGRAHIGFFGSIDSIAEEKRKIFSRFAGSQVGFIHEDEKFFSILSREVDGKINRYGIKNTPGFSGYEALGIDGYIIDYKDVKIKFPLAGIYNLNNALGAISVADYLAIKQSDIKKGLESVEPLFGRGEVIKNDVTIIRDCYNANPESISESIACVDELQWDGRKVFVIGSMLELGDISSDAHAELGKRVAGSNADAVFFFGKETEVSCREFRCDRKILNNKSVTSCWTSSFNELREQVLDYIKTGDLVFLKGSRSLELERLTTPILDRSASSRIEGKQTYQKGNGC